VAGRIAVVDAADRFVRWAPRAEIHRDRLVHRSVHVLVFDPAGRLVLQRRHPEKDNFPDHWDSSCAGHVEESDYPGGPDADLDAVYAAVARRELEEELGLAVGPEELAELGHFGPAPGVHYEQLRLYRTVSDGPFRLAPDEVAEVRRFTPADYDALAAGGAPVTGALKVLVDFVRARGLWSLRRSDRRRAPHSGR